MIEWIQNHPAIVWSVAGLSAIVFVISLLIMPAVVVRIPVDYFAHPRRPPSVLAGRSMLVRVSLRLAKNITGCVFLVAGVAMLALPGQGLLTILVGFLLLDIPGKYRVEKWLVQRKWVSRSINWLRRRRGREPLDAGPPST